MAGLASDAPKLEAATINEIVVDGLVISKIIKHCRDNMALLVDRQLPFGQLVGIDREDSMTVTNCFPYPNQKDEDQEALGEYSLDMLRCFKEANLDNNPVGWYQATYMGTFLTESFVRDQYSYQSHNKNSVVIVYDPFKTTRGHLSLHAFRLTHTFLQQFDTEESKKNGYGNISFNQVVEEVPIVIQNSTHLSNIFLDDLSEANRLNVEHSRLNLTSDAFLEKNLGGLLENLDDMNQEHNKYLGYQKALSHQQQKQAIFWQKRHHENKIRLANGQPPIEDDPVAMGEPAFRPLAVPSRLDSLLLARQAVHYSRQINQYTNESLTKMLVLQNFSTN